MLLISYQDKTLSSPSPPAEGGKNSEDTKLVTKKEKITEGRKGRRNRRKRSEENEGRMRGREEGRKEEKEREGGRMGKLKKKKKKKGRNEGRKKGKRQHTRLSSTSRKAGHMGWTLTWPVAMSVPHSFGPSTSLLHVSVFTLACFPACFVCQNGISRMLFQQAFLPAMPAYLAPSSKLLPDRNRDRHTHPTPMPLSIILLV